jgi:hypothetical protein
MPPDTHDVGAPFTETLDAATIAARAAIARAAAGELLGPTDIQAIWRIRRTQFHRLNRMHAFDQFRVHPAVGPKCFSGTLITRYLAGESLTTSPQARRGAWRTP